MQFQRAAGTLLDKQETADSSAGWTYVGLTHVDRIEQ